jgi:hypothetical protein
MSIGLAKHCIAFALLAVQLPAHAAPPAGTIVPTSTKAQAFGQEIIDTARRNVSSVMQIYRPFLIIEAPYLFEPGAVRVAAYADFNAFVSREHKHIILPAMLIR